MFQALRLPPRPPPPPPLLFASVLRRRPLFRSVSRRPSPPSLAPPPPPLLGFLLQGEQDSSNKKTKVMAPETGLNTRRGFNNGRVAAAVKRIRLGFGVLPLFPSRTASHRTALHRAVTPSGGSGGGGRLSENRGGRYADAVFLGGDRDGKRGGGAVAF